MKSWRFGQSLQVHQTATPSLKLAAAELRDVKARLQLLTCLHTSLSACPSAAPVLRCHIILISRLKNLFAETLICIIPVMTLKLQLSYLTLHVPH